MSRYWYAFTGADGQEQTLSKYSLIDNPNGCEEGHFVCAIYAPSGSLHPSVISDNLVTYIGNGKSSGLNQPTFPVGSQLFVYTRTTT